MYFIIEANLAKQRHEEMIQEAERERMFDRSASVKVNLVTSAINVVRSAFTRGPQPHSSGAHQTVTAR